MSRTMRHDIVRGTGLPKKTKREMAKAMAIEIRRRLIAAGVVSNPALAGPKYEWHWETATGAVGGIQEANTKGEARSQIKAALGLKSSDTLPHGIRIVRVTPSAATSQLPRTYQNSPEPAGSDSDHLRDDGPVGGSDGTNHD